LEHDPPIQTGSQTVGPFFHYGLLFGGENVLVTDATRGPRIRLVGTVYDGDGAPAPDAIVEIWQADAQGYFNHPSDPNRDHADPAFHGFGRADTIRDGTYAFTTVKPGAVPGEGPRAPSVNVRVFARGMLIHAVTRLYFGDEATNASDPVLLAVDPARRPTLVAPRLDTGDLPTYRFDIHLQGEGETVFFDL
jgi:protocatechuate 3,4-dioxygenase alpha subunit